MTAIISKYTIHTVVKNIQKIRDNLIVGRGKAGIERRKPGKQ